MLGLDFGPDEHAGPRFFVGPAEAIEAAADNVAALGVNLRLLIGRFGVLAHGDDAGDLNRRENAVIVIAFDRRERFYHLRISRAEAHAPAGHVVALAHGGEFDAQVLGALG